MARLTEGGGWWRADALAREVAANLWARRGRYGALSAMVAAVLGALLWADFVAARSAIDDRRDVLAAGGTVIIVEREQGGLDAAVCVALSRQPYVVATGGLTHGEPVYFDHAPGTPFASMRITGDLIAVIDPDAAATMADGLILPSGAAAELGAVAGSRLSLQGRAWTVSEVVEPDPRAPTISRAVLLPEAPTGTIGQCWVEFDSGAFDDGVTALPAWFAAGGLSMTPLLERNVGTRDVAADWAGRPTRHGWVAGGLVIAAFALLLCWRRRAELALYVLLGTARPMVVVLQAAELYVAVAIGGLLGVLWAAAAATVASPAGTAAVMYGSRAGVLGLTLALALIPVLCTWLARTDLVTALKERAG